ncbi:MAG: class I SAM-dependent methyltransferase [Patescibacteria group bacterium]|nr:class I SAM-dependent methyltransferase [Patescibacteria group bacterium]
MVCNICGKLSKNFYKLYDDRYAYPGFFDIYECSNCKHKFTNHNFVNKDLTELYTNYYPRKELDVLDYKPFEIKNNFSEWLKGVKSHAYTYIPEKVRVLDVGCGFCQSIGYHINRGCEAFGVEVDSNVKKIIAKHNFNVKIGLFKAGDYRENYFDYVTLDQVLEHSINPKEFLFDINKVLKNDGSVVISIPNANSLNAKIFKRKWIHWHIPYHLNFFSKESLETLAKETGFEIKSIKTITSSDWLYYQEIHLVTQPQEGEESIFWTNKLKEKLDIKKKFFIGLFGIFHKLRINHLLTRLIDILNMGDNYVVILKKKV